MSDKKIVVELNSSEVATILAALRLFQREYEDMDSVSIADAWPMHFNVQGDGDEAVVVPQPLGTQDIDTLCEHINCSLIAEAESDEEEPIRFRNHYLCPNDGAEWSDESSCRCNDKCSKCNAEIEPYESEDIEPAER